MVGDDGILATVTHARLRADQGDVQGARHVLRAVLRIRPGDREARSLLERLDGMVHRPGTADVPQDDLEPEAAHPKDLRLRFAGELATAERGAARRRTITRLRSWLDRARRATGESDA